MAVDFSSSGLAFFVLTTVFVVICGIFMVLRFVSMRISRRRFYLDDGYILFAYGNVVALGGVGIWSSVNGLGKSDIILTDYEISAAAKLLFTAYICWLLASVFYKLAILALYNRLFSTAQFRRWSYGVSALVAAYGVGFFCVYMTDCEPIDYMWNPTPGGHCRDGRVSDYSTLAINMFLDLVIFILPLPTLWSLKLPSRKKAVVTVMFSLGLATIGAMIWRVIWTRQYRANPDFTSYLSLIAIVSGFELWFGVIAANIPTLAPLFRSGRFEQSTVPKQSGVSISGGSQTPIHLQTLQSRTTRGGGYDRIYGGRDPFFLESRNEEESHLVKPPGAVAVTADCAYDPNTQHPEPVLAPDAIYVRTNIET